MRHFRSRWFRRCAQSSPRYIRELGADGEAAPFHHRLTNALLSSGRVDTRAAPRFSQVSRSSAGMGSRPERRVSASDSQANEESFSAKAGQPMATSESPNISLVTSVANKPRAWFRSMLSADNAFRWLMTLAALAVLAAVGLI